MILDSRVEAMFTESHWTAEMVLNGLIGIGRNPRNAILLMIQACKQSQFADILVASNKVDTTNWTERQRRQTARLLKRLTDTTMKNLEIQDFETLCAVVQTSPNPRIRRRAFTLALNYCDIEQAKALYYAYDDEDLLGGLFRKYPSLRDEYFN